MLIYHGTRVENISSILRLGLLPRMSENSSWHNLPSRDDAVYLSNAFAPFYAHHCDMSMGSLVEIDLGFLGQNYLCPDEDFLEQSHKNLDVGDTIEERTGWFRDNLKSFQHLWQDSLQELGNCCYIGTIPLSAISRITKWCATDLEILHGWSELEFVSIEHYKAEGRLYRLLTKCFAKRKVNLDELLLLAKERQPEANFDEGEYKSYLIKDIERITIVYDKKTSNNNHFIHT
jgi:hypothetical protein